MKKQTKSLSDQEWKKLVHNFLKKLAKSSMPERGDATEAARALNKSSASIGQMKSDAKGSVISWIRLAAFRAGLSDQEAKQLLQNPVSILRNLEKPSLIEELFDAVKKRYSTDELTAWLKLLLAKADVEKSLGIEVKASTATGKTSTQAKKK